MAILHANLDNLFCPFVVKSRLLRGPRQVPNALEGLCHRLTRKQYPHTATIVYFSFGFAA